MIKIAGLDMSISCTGVTVETLDDEFNIKEIKTYSFTDAKKWEQDNIIYCKPDQFNNKYDRYFFMFNKILDWTKDCEYIAIEDYALGAMGMVFDLAEFEGYIKLSLYNSNKKLRTYSVPTNKKFFSGSGSSDKLSMKYAFDEYKGIKPDISNLPEITKGDGVKPTSDIIDSFALCEFLRKELRLKNNIETIEQQPEHIKSCFISSNSRKKTKEKKKRKKKDTIDDLLIRDFISKK